MILKKTARKLETLYEELKARGSARIESAHVEEILDKIARKERNVLEALNNAPDQAERDRLTRKLAVIEEQKKRAEELLGLVRDDRA